MIPRRNISVYMILLLILLISFVFIFLKIDESTDAIEIRIYTDRIINSNFYGFGVETLPWLWTKENREAGVNEEDIRLNAERIKDMHLPVTRIFVPWETWNPSVDYKTFTWETDEMRSLYKILELYQETGTEVILVTVDWLKDSPWRDAEASAGAVLRLLEYLIKDKGYSCIKFWTLTNEPELTYQWMKKLPFENYVRIHRLVRKGLKERKLSIKIIASDEAYSQEWFERSVQSLYDVADIFSSHAYFYPHQMHLIPDFFIRRLDIIKAGSLAKRDIPFFICEFGFRGFDFSTLTNSFMRDYRYGLLTSEFAIDILNFGVDGASFWCLQEIYLLDGRMMQIGLWGYKDEDWQPKPVFYAYSLFTKYIKRGSRVLRIDNPDSSRIKVACISYNGRKSIFVLNKTDLSQTILLKGLERGSSLKRYLYSSSTVPVESQQLLLPDRLIEIKHFLRDEIPGRSLALYTMFD